MMEFDPELIVMQAASTDPDSRMIEAVMSDVLMMAHAETTSMRLSWSENTFGWNFYTISVDKQIVKQLAQLPVSGVLNAKGDSLEQKFVSWLNQRSKARDARDRLYFNLLSDLRSSATDYSKRSEGRNPDYFCFVSSRNLPGA